MDYLEYDIDPNVWINRLLKQLRTGNYNPEIPTRYTLAKSKGFSRIITMPAIPDVVLYRTIVDYLFHKAQKKQKKHVYFCQSNLSKTVRRVESEAQNEIKNETGETDYPNQSRSSFLEWLKYDQYRKLLIFDKVYPFIVITDITNYFDSVLYGRIEESLYDLPVPSKMVSLLFSLLERLSVREPISPVQRIGLPVDQCDCSRCLAHMALFPHDERMVEAVGEDAYVRWMDDQNFGVETKSEGLHVLSKLNESLRRLHLTPNAGKSKILSLREAKVHFHFDTNRLLDNIDSLPYKSEKERKTLRKELKEAWQIAIENEDNGEWQKVLKRFYRYAARARSRMLRSRAAEDLKKHPGLVDRIADYLRYVVPPDIYIETILGLLNDPEQIYPDVNYQLIESLIKLEPETSGIKKLRKIAQSIFSNSLKFAGSEECKVLVPLLYLRYGDRRNIKGLAGKIGAKLDRLPPPITRSICAVLASCGKTEFKTVQIAASRLLRNHLSEFVKMISRIEKFGKVEGRFKARITIFRDSITGSKYIDMRSLLAARLLGLSKSRDVQLWLSSKRESLLADDLSDFDKALIRRLWP